MATRGSRGLCFVMQLHIFVLKIVTGTLEFRLRRIYIFKTSYAKLELEPLHQGHSQT